MELGQSRTIILLEERLALLQQLAQGLRDVRVPLVSCDPLRVDRCVEWLAQLCRKIAAVNLKLNQCSCSSDNDHLQQASKTLLLERCREVTNAIQHLNRVQAALLRKVWHRFGCGSDVFGGYTCTCLPSPRTLGSTSANEGPCRI